jgi:hypothetical protein
VMSTHGRTGFKRRVPAPLRRKCFEHCDALYSRWARGWLKGLPR